MSSSPTYFPEKNNDDERYHRRILSPIADKELIEQRIEKDPGYREKLIRAKADEYITTTLRINKGQSWENMIHTLENQHNVPEKILKDVAISIVSDPRTITHPSLIKENSYLIEYNNNQNNEQR